PGLCGAGTPAPVFFPKQLLVPGSRTPPAAIWVMFVVTIPVWWVRAATVRGSTFLCLGQAYVASCRRLVVQGSKRARYRVVRSRDRDIGFCGLGERSRRGQPDSDR